LHAYGPLCTLFYDADKPRASDEEVEWHAQRLPLAAGLSLELMCGSGRLLVPLLARGAKVHGVDHSAPMLASCEARLAAAGLAAPLFRQDITQMNLPFRYVAAFAAAGSFQLITDPVAAVAALQRIRAHLVAPGLLLLDLFVPAESAQRLGAPLVEVRTLKLADGTLIALRSETTMWAEARLARAENRYAHRRGAQRLGEEHETLTLTWYSPEEITALVSDADFRDVRIETSAPTDDGAARFSLSARL
jgi:SAM-dependent methyltransferase